MATGIIKRDHLEILIDNKIRYLKEHIKKIGEINRVIEKEVLPAENIYPIIDSTTTSTPKELSPYLCLDISKLRCLDVNLDEPLKTFGEIEGRIEHCRGLVKKLESLIEDITYLDMVMVTGDELKFLNNNGY